MQVEQIDREAAARLMTVWDDGDLHCDDFVEAFARHRHQARAEVVGEIVAWLRVQQHGRTSDNYPGYFARQIEAKFGTTQAG